MHRKEFKKSLNEGKHVFGTNLPVQSADLIERIGYIGYDWVMIDDEHVFNNDETMGNMIRAAEVANMTPLIRLRDPSPSWCYQFLDMGVGGIILSHTESAEEVLDLIDACKFPPVGHRGATNKARAMKFGLDYIGQEKRLADLNAETFLMPLVETLAGIEQLEAIASVDGVDGVFIGPGDLALDMGVPFGSDQVLEKVDQAIATVVKAGKFPCTISSGAMAKSYIDKGVSLVLAMINYDAPIINWLQEAKT